MSFAQVAETAKLAAREMTTTAASQAKVEQTTASVVAALVKEREALRTTFTEARALARGSVEGSEQQVAAIRVATDAAHGLGLSYQEAGAAAVASSEKAAAAMISNSRKAAAAARESTALSLSAAKESQFARGFGTRAGGMAALGSTSFLIGAGLGIAIRGLTKEAAGFEAEMRLVQTQAGASAKEVDVMTDAVKRLSVQVGTTPEDLAKGLFHIESAGLRGAKALRSLRIAAEGAKVGHADLESVTNALVAAYSSGIKGAGNFAHTMGVLNAVVGAGNMRMEDLASAMSTGILPVAKTMGVSIQEVGAALATMTVRGVPAVEAATRLRMTMSLMAAPTKKATDALGSIGLTQRKLADDMREHGLLFALRDLQAHLQASGKDATEQGQVISAAFGGGRTSGTIRTLLTSLDDVDKRLQQVGRTSGDFGKSWQKTTEETAFRFDRFRAAVHLAGISIGEALAPSLAAASAAIAKFLAHAEKTGQLQRWTEEAASGVRSLARAIGEALHITNRIAHAFGGWHTTLVLAAGAFAGLKVAALASMLQIRIATLATATSMKAALISTGIGAIIVAMGMVTAYTITHWEQVKGWFQAFGQWLKQHAYVLLAVPIIGQFAFAAEKVMEHWGGLKQFFARLWDNIKLQALRAYLAIIEPFTHLPFGMGKWAQRAKKNVEAEMDDLRADMATIGRQTGDAWGRAMSQAAARWLDKVVGDARLAANYAKASVGGVGAAAGGSPQRQRAAGARGGGPGAGGRGTAQQQGIVRTARSQLGIPYKFGGPAALDKSTDCSGLAKAVLEANGVHGVPRTSQQQWQHGQPVPWGELEPGDLVFFDTHGPSPGHVGIYVGGTQMIHDPHTGKSVEYADITSQYWRSHYVGARRYVASARPHSGGGGAGAGGKRGGGPGGTPYPTAATVSGKPLPTTKKKSGERGRVLTPGGGKVTDPVILAIVDAANKYNLDPAAMIAIAEYESGLDPRKIGDHGCSIGLFQLNRCTGVGIGHSVAELMDPRKNAMIAAAAYAGKGISGKRGRKAIHEMVYEVQRPKDKPREEAAALAGYEKARAILQGASRGGIGSTESRAETQLEQRRRRRGAVGAISRQLSAELAEANKLIAQGFFTPETAAALRERIARLRKLIRDSLKDGIVTEAEYKRIRSAWLSVADTIKQGVKAAAAAAVGMRIVRATIKAALKDGLISDSELDTISQRLEGLQGRIAAHMRALVKTIQQDRQKLADAWGRVKDTILQAFDERVIQRVAHLREFGGEALTRATARVQERRAQGRIASLEAGGPDPVMATIKATAQKLIDAYKAFTTAMRGASGGTSLSGDQAGVEKAAEALADAQAEWDGLSGEWTDTEQAYRDAWQTMIDSEKTLADDALDQYQRAQEQKAQLAKKVVGKQLDKVYADLRAGKITLEQAEQTINQILAPFGLSLADLGNVLDTSDLQDALGDLEKAVVELTKALRELTGKGGGADKAGGDTHHAAPGPSAGTGPLPPGAVAETDVTPLVVPLTAAISSGFDVLKSAITATLPHGVVPLQHGTDGWRKVSRPMLALLGEGHEPEWLNVVPQSKLHMAGGGSHVTHVTHNVTLPPVTVNVNGPMIATSERSLAEKLAPHIREPIQNEIRAWRRRTGRDDPFGYQ
jgi:TP901 family phage tail tape measure protein